MSRGITTTSLLVFFALCALAHAKCTSTTCPSASCCDTQYGSACYQSATQRCATDLTNGKNYVCPAGQSSCAGFCFNTLTQTCQNGKLVAIPRSSTKASTFAASTTKQATSSSAASSSVPATKSSTTKATTSSAPTTSLAASTVPSTVASTVAPTTASSVPSTAASTVAPTSASSVSSTVASTTPSTTASPVPSTAASTVAPTAATPSSVSTCGSGCGAGFCSCNGVCYPPDQYNCLTDAVSGQQVLCFAGSQVCNGACYDATVYVCVNGGLYQQGQAPAPIPTSSTPVPTSSPVVTSSSPVPTTSAAVPTSSTPVAASSSQVPTSVTPVTTSVTPVPTSSTPKASSSASPQSSNSAATSVASPVTPPAPVPLPISCGGASCPSGQGCCAGSCYDTTLFGCSSNVDGSNQFLCPAVQPALQPKFWVETISHTGIAAFNPTPNSYVVYRNVKDFGAKGDGVTDDTNAINAAITAYGRCGQGCDSTTIRPAVVYFPAGQYVISSPIIQYYFTQLIGDATHLPSIVAAPGFHGVAMIDSDPYANTGNNWYTNQNNFYRQIRNFVLDTTRTGPTAGTTGIHWQVAQATSLTNIVFQMSTAAGNNHQGIWMENGSGGFISDLVFYGGKFAMWVGNQQFTSRNITIYNVDTAIYMNWNWGWTFKTLTISGARIGLDMSSSDSTGNQLVGSVILVDVTMTNVVTGIITATTATSLPDTSGSLLVDNGYFTGVSKVIATPSGAVLLAGQAQGTLYVPTWAQGSVYNQAASGTFQQGFISQPKRPSALTGNNANGYYFERQRPQYENYASSSFVSVKDNGAYGDGIHDDTAAIAQTLAKYAGCRIIYFPAGTYLISSTVLVPAGSRIVGEAWSQIMAKGAAFQDASNPVPMLKIGRAGDVGGVELSDLLFTASGPQPGAILVEWNIRDPVGQPGASGMWDCHFRVGGAAGTGQQVAQCPSLASPKAACVGTFMMLHLTASSSAYLENVWVWTADHDLDGNGQVSIYNGRGLLCESQHGVWLYGTAVEHNTLYQYTFLNAKNVLMAMIQTETPYYQAGPAAPAPWTTNSGWTDPDFSGCPAGSPSCGMAWGLRQLGSTDIYMYGGGLYNFFRNYDQTCLDTEDCQDAMVDIQAPNQSATYFFGLNTKASVAMVQTFGKTSALARDNVNTFCSTVHYLANAQ